jgi:hypothetical protein
MPEPVVDIRPFWLGDGDRLRALGYEPRETLHLGKHL